MSASHEPRGRLGLCLPAPHWHGSTRSRSQRSRNPFPSIAGGVAWTISPIKTAWLDLDGETALADEDNAIDLQIYLSHESLHLFLTDTSFHYYTHLVTQCQYIMLWGLLSDADSTNTISVPSLSEPWGIMNAGNRALDHAEWPLALIQELMANSLQHFYAERDTLPLAAHLALGLGSFAFSDLPNMRSLPLSESPPDNSEDLIDALWFIASNPSLSERLAASANVAGAYYGSMFDAWLATVDDLTRAKTFRSLEQQLMFAWRKLGDTADGVDDRLILSLARYPLDVPPDYEQELTWNSLNDVLHGSARHLVDVATLPLQRLRQMLDAVHQAPPMATSQDWELYLASALPDYQPDWVSASESLAMVTERLWETYGITQMATFFRNLYARTTIPFMLGSGISFPHPTDPGGLVAHQVVGRIYRDPAVHHAYRWIFNSLNTAITLEILRQALRENSGLSCFCSDDAAEQCPIRPLLDRLKTVIRPDDTNSEEFARRWHHLGCLELTGPTIEAASPAAHRPQTAPAAEPA